MTDVRSGRVVWSERYERPLQDVFAVEDEITMSTVMALQVKLTAGEQARSRVRRTDSFRAWELATRAYLLASAVGPEQLAEARQLFEQALALDRNTRGPARTWRRPKCSKRASASCPTRPKRRSVHTKRRNAPFRPMLNCPMRIRRWVDVLLARADYPAAVAAGRTALQLGPNDADVHAAWR